MIEFFKVIGTSNGATKRVVVSRLRGVGAAGDDDGAEPIDDAEVLFPIGYAARPYLTDHETEAVVVRIGDEVEVLGLIDKSGTVLDLEEGEVRISGHKEPTARLRLRANGSVDLESKSDQDVRLNGGSLKAARVTDPVRIGTLAGVTSGGPVTFTFQPLDANGAPAGSPDVNATVTLVGVISNAGGAARVKA